MAKKSNQIVYGVDDELKVRIIEGAEERQMPRSVMNRIAIIKYLDEGKTDALLLLNLIQIVQVVNDLQKEVKPECMERLQSLTENLIKIKGGK